MYIIIVMDKIINNLDEGYFAKVIKPGTEPINGQWWVNHRWFGRTTLYQLSHLDTLRWNRQLLSSKHTQFPISNCSMTQIKYKWNTTWPLILPLFRARGLWTACSLILDFNWSNFLPSAFSYWCKQTVKRAWKRVKDNTDPSCLSSWAFSMSTLARELLSERSLVDELIWRYACSC